MQILYPSRLSYHWHQIEQTIRQYHDTNNPDDVLLLGSYIENDIDEFRKLYPNSKIIIFQTEPLLSKNHCWTPEYLLNKIKKVDEVWDYDFQNVLYLKQHGINAVFKPLCLYTKSHDHIITVDDPPIDVLFYGSGTEHRLDYIRTITKSNLSFVYVSMLDGPALDELISKSKVIVNIHQNKNQQQEQTRITYLLSNGKCVISEKSPVNYYGDTILELEGMIKIYRKCFDYSRGGYWKEMAEQSKMKFQQFNTEIL